MGKYFWFENKYVTKAIKTFPNKKSKIYPRCSLIPLLPGHSVP